MAEASSATPLGYSYLTTAGWFIAGGVVTAIFSASLDPAAVHAELFEVLLVGMLVPSFTWVVQTSASLVGMSATSRRLYWGDLGRICLLGSFALLPAAIVNLVRPPAPLWFSAANVLASVVLMAVWLFRLTGQHGIAKGWPISWCLTITVNMGLFVWSSRNWW